MTDDLAALVARLQHIASGMDDMELLHADFSAMAQAAAAIESLAQRIDGYRASRDYAIDLLAKALGVEADKVRAVEYYARKAAEKIESLAADNARLEREIGTAREVAMIRHCDVNANGKTILDFHEVWLRQANERAERAEAESAQLMREIQVVIKERDALRQDAEYYKWRLREIIPLFEEARDALPAITIVSAKLRNIDLSLGDRMDRAGTRTRADFDAALAQAAKPTPAPPE